MPNTWQTGALLEPGLRSEHAFIYAQEMESVAAKLGDVAWLDVTSDKLQEVRGFMESAGYFQHWPDGPIPTVSTGSQRFVVRNVDFGLRRVLPRNLNDEQTGGTVMAAAREFASAQAALVIDGFYQMMQSTTQNNTTAPYPTILTAADGTGPYSTSTRYGSSSGNVVTVTSTSTVQGVINDIMSVKRRFTEFQNTQNHPYWVRNEMNNMTLFHGPTLTGVMTQAEFQTRVPWEQTSGTNATGQTPTNLLQDSRTNIRYVNDQRITGSLYYTWLRGVPGPKRAFFRQVRKSLTQWDGNFAVSDYARDFGRVYVQADCRETWGSALMISSIRVGS